MNLNSKIIYGLERLTDAFKALLWDKAKLHGLSPTQIQILLFIVNHKRELCNVSHLAREFNVTKPTISDAVRVLINKDYLRKEYSSLDSRSYSLFVSDKGEELIDLVSEYTLPFETALKSTGDQQLEDLYSLITELIYKLNKQGIIQVQRTCFSCKFYGRRAQNHYCNLLNKPLEKSEIQLDCPEYEEKI